MDEDVKQSIYEFIQEEFLKFYDEEKSRQVWREQSQKFRNFWKNRIMQNDHRLSEDEMIPIIQILDTKGKRRTAQERKVEGIAFTNIFQPKWYRMFRELIANKKIKTLVDTLLKSNSDRDQIELLNEIKEINVGPIIYALTGENGTIINDFLFAYNPKSNISVVALTDRYKIINFFELYDVQQLKELSWGEKIILSRQLILPLNEKLNLNTDSRGVCAFLYAESIKRLWKQELITEVKKIKKGRTDVLGNIGKRPHAVGPLINFRDMVYGPTEENGVIFLFSKITDDLGIQIESIQKRFPDAKAIKYGSDGKGHEVFIEFEYRSSDFIKHGHLEQMKKGKPCDLIVCWEHDSKDIPKEIEVLELREYIKMLPDKNS